MSVVHSGYLVKEGGSWKSWKRRYFELRGSSLSYFKKLGDATPVGLIDLNECTSVMAVSYKKENAFCLDTPGRKYYICADTPQERDSWVSVLSKTIQSQNAPASTVSTPSTNPSFNVSPPADTMPPSMPPSGMASSVAPPVLPAGGVSPGSPVSGTGAATHDAFVPASQAGSAGPGKKKICADDFDLIKLVGKGSFGKVMQVRYKETGQIFAMKVLNKAHIVEHNEVEHTKSELHILQSLHHPFLMNLHFSFQTEDNLYFILDFVNGGELFFHLQQEKRFSIERTRFYAAEILLALEHLHDAGIVYRDLKPENLLLQRDGHICMTDFGLCKEGLNKPSDTTDTFCGTPEYLAPEILLGTGYGKAVDWWSYGCLVYEMIVGLPPFYSQDVQEMYQKIISDPLTFPPYVPPDAQEMLVRLLDRNPETRLADPREIKKCSFFASVNWDDVYNKRVVPEYIPPVSDSHDTTQIDSCFTDEAPSLDPDEPASVSVQDQKDFAGFTFVANPQ